MNGAGVKLQYQPAPPFPVNKLDPDFTHIPLNKMAILQTMFLDAFSWTQSLYFD